VVLEAAEASPGEAERTSIILTFDLEDWHQLVHRRAGVEGWDRPNAEFRQQVDAVLAFLEAAQARATFFVLGMAAKNYPDVVRAIGERGYELACHGYAHELVYRQTPDGFGSDVERCCDLVQELSGSRPVGYRAPAFSFTRATPWAFDVLAEHGIRYDSSLYDSPRIANRVGGIPVHPCAIRVATGQEVLEYPVAVWPLAGGRSLPIGGGSYWRLLPAALLKRALAAAHRHTSHPVLYFHPYEMSRTPLRTSVRTPSLRGALRARSRSAWRNLRREAVPAALRDLARSFRLVACGDTLDEIARRYGARPRALSQEGVLV
jgi:polysaccharide deacetylase family protein (PEP-CTERM system associated)